MITPRRILTALILSIAAMLASCSGGTAVAPPDSGKDLSAAQLIITTTVSGVELLELEQPQSGGEVLKTTGRRIEVIEPPSNASIGLPFVISGNKYYFKGLPSGRRLNAAISYRPTVNLATGAKGSSSSLADLVLTAVPFELPASGGPVQIDAKINISPNPDGGYFVDLDTAITVPGKALRRELTRLYYRDGELSRDSNSNLSFSDEPRFDDSDCDCISDQLSEQSEDLNTYASQPGLAVLEADLSTLDFDAGVLTLENLSVSSSDFPLTATTLEVQLSEDTYFSYDTDPWDWPAGQQLSVMLLRFSDPGLPDEYWALEVDEVTNGGSGSGTATLSASDHLAEVIELSWTAAGEYDGFTIECWGIDPESADTWLEWSGEYAADEFTATDDGPYPGDRYLYTLIGILPDGSELPLAQDFGATVAP